MKKKANKVRIAVAAAVGLFVVAAGAVMIVSKLAPKAPTGPAMVVNPVKSVSAQELEKIGFVFRLPEGAAETAYSVIDTGEENPMAQARFGYDGKIYTCRAKKCNQPEDISGLYYTWDESDDWEQGVKLQYRASGNDACWLGWYDAEHGIQWCLTSDGAEDKESLLAVAQGFF